MFSRRAVFFMLGALWFLCSSLHGAAQSDSAVVYGENPKAAHWLTTRGFRIYYETYGQGDPLLMIHGNGGSIENFKHQIPYFSKKYHVIAVDSRAQGKSIDMRDSLSFEMMADDFNALLDSLHIDSCFVLGWSDGGINGLLLAMRHPDKVKKLAETGANLWPDSTAVGDDVKNMQQWYDQLRKETPTPEVKQQLKLVALDLYQPHIEGNELKEVHCPALIIGGDHDIILPEHTLYIWRHIPHAWLWIVPNSGHATLIEHADCFNKTVDAFFTNSHR
ncbi:MAG: alpha/beta fold hydrolase [Microbacter sp.]